MKSDTNNPSNQLPKVSSVDEWDEWDELDELDEWDELDEGVDSVNEKKDLQEKGLPRKVSPPKNKNTVAEDKVRKLDEASSTDSGFNSSPSVLVGKKKSQIYEIGGKEKNSKLYGKPSVELSQLTTKKDEGGSTRTLRKSRGERHDWGEVSRDRSVKWMVWLGVFLVFVGLVIALQLNQKLNDGPVRDSQKSEFSKIFPVSEAFENREGDGDMSIIISEKKEAVKIYEKFINADSPEDFIEFVAGRDKVSALIKKTWKDLYKGEDFWRVSDESIWKALINERRSFGELIGEKPDFTRFNAYFVLEAGELKLDWKATTGYSSVSFDELSQSVGEVSEIRVWIEVANFYTNIFTDSEYFSIRLYSPDKKHILWGYVPREVALFEEIEELFKTSQITGKRKTNFPIILKLQAGPEGCLPNQWIVDEIVGITWLEK